MAQKVGASVTVTRKVFVKTVDGRDVEEANAKLAEHLLSRARGKSKNGRGKHAQRPLEISDIEVDPADAEKFHIPKLGSKLWVAEALVKPLDGSNGTTVETGTDSRQTSQSLQYNPTQQLRISLTGPTTCGKSTLLGTLTTGKPDNGRGKSRLSLLRHRHELVSGVTSSVAWELIGYKTEGSHSSGVEEEGDEFGWFGGRNDNSEDEVAMSRVVNYATGNVSSWTDIHSAAEGGRIVFLSDSAGQLKYRRTTIRSLVGWAPHYVALLIPANDRGTEDINPGLSADSQIHMDLCIKLALPLIVIFTKMDIASKPGLREVLSGVLSSLKKRGKKPVMVQNSAKVKDAVKAIAGDPTLAVPIIFSSSVKGDGINLVHELLMSLPMPDLPAAPVMPHTSLTQVTKGIDSPASGDRVELWPKPHDVDAEAVDQGDPEMTTLFHVEEVYGFKPTVDSDENSGGSVVSGHVRYGKVSIGDRLVVGPFNISEVHRSCSATPTPTMTPVVNSLLSISAQRNSSGLLSRSPESGDEIKGGASTSNRARSDERSDEPITEWRLVCVVSVRRLRLPVTALFAGEAGTIGIIPIWEAYPLPSPVDVKSGIIITATEVGTIQPINIGHRSSPPGKKAVTFASPPPSAAHEHGELRLKKGLVILNRSVNPVKELWMKAYTGFTAILDDEDTAAQSLVVGSDVTVYIASVRAVARVVFIDPPTNEGNGKEKESLGVFGFEDDDGEEGEEEVETPLGRERGRFGFEFAAVEWIEFEAKVLVMKSQSSKGAVGMEVFVGRVAERMRDLDA
jgi:energy-coupling factor transporter ATP-binding protein EcfA2